MFQLHLYEAGLNHTISAARCNLTKIRVARENVFILLSDIRGYARKVFLFHHKLSEEKNPKLPAKNIEKDEAGHTTPCQVSTLKKQKRHVYCKQG